MSDNKKYYYLQLKENFFDSDEMKIIGSKSTGFEYQKIYLQLCLLSLKSDGWLIFKDQIPYDAELLSRVLKIRIPKIKRALAMFEELGLIEINEENLIFMSDIENFIGKSSTKSIKNKINYQKTKIKNQKVSNCENEVIDNNVMKTNDIQEFENDKNGLNSVPEIELKTEKELELELKTELKDFALSGMSVDPLFSIPYSQGIFQITRHRFDDYKKKFPKLDMEYELSEIEKRANDESKPKIGSPTSFINGFLETATHEHGGKTRFPKCDESELKTLRFSNPEMLRLHGRIREYVIANDIGSHIVPEFYRKFHGSTQWSSDWLSEFEKFVRGLK